MCPDRELLSAWLDGEVPSPWRETIKRHLDDCVKCASVVDEYRALSATMADEGVGLDDNARTRVLDRLYRAMPMRRPLWGQRLSLPLPAAAAAALLLGAMALGLALSGARNAELRLAMSNAMQPGPAVATGLGMESILEYLSRQDAGVNISITLPAGSPVYSSGEPFMIREVDYRPGSGK